DRLVRVRTQRTAALLRWLASRHRTPTDALYCGAEPHGCVLRVQADAAAAVLRRQPPAIPCQGDEQMTDRRRPIDSREAAERAFKAATTKPAELPAKKAAAIPGVKEMVSLRIDRDVLDFFQEDGPGWQDRINDALRKAAGK